MCTYWKNKTPVQQGKKKQINMFKRCIPGEFVRNIIFHHVQSSNLDLPFLSLSLFFLSTTVYGHNLKYFSSTNQNREIWKQQESISWTGIPHDGSSFAHPSQNSKEECIKLRYWHLGCICIHWPSSHLGLEDLEDQVASWRKTLNLEIILRLLWKELIEHNFWNIYTSVRIEAFFFFWSKESKLSD